VASRDRPRRAVSTSLLQAGTKPYDRPIPTLRCSTLKGVARANSRYERKVRR